MLDIIIGILLIIVFILLGVFAIGACIISSGCSKYEGYERKKE